MNNKDKYKEYKLKKIYKYLIIILSFTTIFLEALALFRVISFLWGFIPYLLIYYLKCLNENISIKDMFKRKNKPTCKVNKK